MEWFRLVILAETGKRFLLGYRLTKAEAKEWKRAYIDLGYPASDLRIEPYSRASYRKVYANGWRVYVDQPAGRIVLGQSLSKSQAKTLFEYAKTIYKPVLLRMEHYSRGIRVGDPTKQAGETVGRSFIEVHHDCDDAFFETHELSGKGLKEKTVSNLTFVQGHSVDRDNRFVPGQLDWSYYELESVRKGISFKEDGVTTYGETQEDGVTTYSRHIERIPCLNPYQRLGVPMVPAETPQRKAERKALEEGVTWSQYLDRYSNTGNELTFAQFKELIRSLYNHSGFVSIKKYLRSNLFIRNLNFSDVDKQKKSGMRLENALFLFDNKIPIEKKEDNRYYITDKNKAKRYVKAPNDLIRKLINISVAAKNRPV